MKEFRMRAFFGILGLAGAGFLLSSVATTVGCSSSDSGGSGGSSGTAGRGGGGTTGSAGTTGTAGTSGGGSGGGGGATGALGCQISDPPAAPPAPVIADFATTDGGAPALAIGGVFAYPSTGGPVAAVANGGWHVTATSTGMTSAQYWGVGIYFNGNPEGTHCVDGTAYVGVKFDISGTIGGTGCSVQYSTNDSAHSNNASDPKGAGDSTSYAPQAPVTVTSAVQTIMMPFTGAGAPTGGSPAVGVAKDKLTGVQWQFTTAAGAANSCMVDIIIDNVAFY
jgi:hypothetical protein